VRPDARMRPGPSVRFKSIDTERLLRFLRSDSVGDSIPRSLLPTRSRQPTTAALSALQCRGDGRCLEMRGSRLANWLLPRDSFAERALLNRRCCEGFGRRPPDSRRRSSSGRHPKPFTIPEVGGLSITSSARPVAAHAPRSDRPSGIHQEAFAGFRKTISLARSTKARKLAAMWRRPG
jgi:hypothetical protein